METSQNGLVMRNVRALFEKGLLVAKVAAAASVQASLALGRADGAQPEEYRKDAENKLAPDEAGVAGTMKGLYPPRRPDAPRLGRPSPIC